MFATPMMMRAAAAGAISFVGRATAAWPGSTSGTRSLSLTGISGLAQNDLVIGQMRAAAGTPGIVSTGWTLEGSNNWFKFMGATPDTAIDFDVSGNNQYAQAANFVALRGVNLTTPLDVATTNSSTKDPAAITPATAGAWILVLGSLWNATGGVDTINTPSDLTNFATVDSADNRSISIGSGLKENWVSGSFDPEAWVDPGGLYPFAATRTFALRPA